MWCQCRKENAEMTPKRIETAGRRMRTDGCYVEHVDCVRCKRSVVKYFARLESTKWQAGRRGSTGSERRSTTEERWTEAT